MTLGSHANFGIRTLLARTIRLCLLPQPRYSLLYSAIIASPQVCGRLVLSNTAFSTTIINPDENRHRNRIVIKNQDRGALEMTSKAAGNSNMGITNEISSHGSRQFYKIPETLPLPSPEGGTGDSANTEKTKKRTKSFRFRGNSRELMEMVDQNIIGRETVFQGPFGPRRCKFYYLDLPFHPFPSCYEAMMRYFMLQL